MPNDASLAVVGNDLIPGRRDRSKPRWVTYRPGRSDRCHPARLTDSNPSTIGWRIDCAVSVRSGATRGGPFFHADASALVKLERDEPESPALQAFLGMRISSRVSLS